MDFCANRVTDLKRRTLAIPDATAPNEEQAAFLRDGMEIILGLLGNVMSGLGEEKH